MANTDYGAMPLTLATAVSQKLNQKLGVTTGFKPSEWADAINLLGRLPNKTVSGSICHFTDGVSLPLVNGKFSISAYQDGTGTPSPSNVRAIHGYTGMDIVRCGKNIVTMFNDGKVPSVTDGRLVNANNYRSDYIKVMANTPYIFSLSVQKQIYMFFYDNNKNFLSYQSVGATYSAITRTTPADCGYIMMRVTTSTESDVAQAQLELGSSATAYSAYNGTTYPLTWQNECYGGYIDYARGKKVTNGYFHTISSSDTFGGFQEQTNTVTCYLSLGASNLPLSVSGGYVTSNRFSNTYPSGTAGRIVNSTTIIYFALSKTELSTLDLDGCIEWFANHPTDIVYELANPTEEDIILPIISVLDGENNIWNTCGDSQVQYRQNMPVGGTVIQYLLDSNSLIPNTYIGKTSPGSQTAYSGWSSTPYIPVTAGEKIKIASTGQNLGYAGWYSGTGGTAGEYVGNFNEGSSGYIEMTVPTGVSYFRYSNSNSGMAKTMIWRDM